MTETDTSAGNQPVGHSDEAQNTNVTLSESQFQQLRDDLKSEVVAEVKADIRDELAGLTSAESEVEVRSDEDNPGLEDIWMAGNPVGKLLSKALQNSSEAKELAEDSGSSPDNPKGEDGEDMAHTLPIQQVTKIWKVGGAINTNKDQHAAAVWSDFMDRCDEGRDVYYLATDKVRQILREHFRGEVGHEVITEGSNDSVRNTVHRAMDVVEEMAGSLVSSDTLRNGRRALMINQQEFQEFHDALAAVSNDVTGDRASNVTGGS